MHRIKRITAIIMCCAVCAVQCGCNDTKPEAGTERNTSAQAVSSALSVQTTQISTTKVTSVQAESVITQASSEAADASDKEQTASEHADYKLDINFVYDQDCLINNEYLNRPMFVSQPKGSEARVYVMRSDREWSNKSYITDQYVIIEHGGIIDEIPCEWMERFRVPFEVYAGDYDGDGENELATVRYALGGTYCRIEQLAIYKRADGHYRCYVFDHEEMLKNTVQWECDAEDRTLTVNTAGYDAELVADTTAFAASGEASIYGGQVVWYAIQGNEIIMEAELFVSVPEHSLPAESVILNMDIGFSDGEFICSNPVLRINESW